MLHSIPLCEYIVIYLIKCLIQTYLGWFQYLTVTNNVAKNVLLHLYLCESISSR